MRTWTFGPAVPHPRGSTFGLRRGLRLAAGAGAAFAALAVLGSTHSPGVVLRHDLVAAATAVGGLPASSAPDDVRQAVDAAFNARPVDVDAQGFPVRVDVTAPALDRETCLEARVAARRIEGRVVVELQRYTRAEDCQATNAMTWRIMP